jgi:hypothetical protein
MKRMDRAAFGGIELEYEMRGAGEDVVFVHHGAGADWFNPLFEEPALAGRFRLLRYHRAGYAGSAGWRLRLLLKMRRSGSGICYVISASAGRASSVIRRAGASPFKWPQM